MVEDFFEVVEAHFDFIKWLQAYMQYGVGAPQEGNSAFEFTLYIHAFEGHHFRFMIVRFEQLSQSTGFDYQAAARGLGRMGGKDKLYRKLMQEFLDGRSIQAIMLE